MTDDIQTVAEQQRKYWNSPVGEKWVSNQSTLDLMFEPLTEILLENAAIKTSEKVLDVGCGAGTTTRILATGVGANGRVLGVDISTALLAAAQAQNSTEHADFFEGDAGSADVPIEDVDLIFSRFGVMFFAQPARAFAHMRKLLQPDGRLCFVCWGPVEHNPWFRISLEVIAKRLGPLEAVNPRAPGPMAFAQTDYIQEFLDEAKFDTISIETREVQLIRREEPVKTAEFMIEFGPGARILAAMDVDEQTRQQLIEEVAEQVEAFKVEDGVRIPTNLHYVRATNSS